MFTYNLFIAFHDRIRLWPCGPSGLQSYKSIIDALQVAICFTLGTAERWVRSTLLLEQSVDAFIKNNVNAKKQKFSFLFAEISPRENE